MPDNTPEIQTIIKTIGSAKRIAIVLPQTTNVDLIGSASALATAVSMSPDKTAMIFSSSAGSVILPFLKDASGHIPQIHTGLNGSEQLAIKISNRNAQPKELRYEKDKDGLTVFITPEAGAQFKEADVSVLPSATNFDLVIILGTASFEQLGNIFTENTKLFFETPNINIDINPANEYFGTINFIKTSASSISEVVMDVIEAMPNVLANNLVSTALLSGIISQTSSFRDPKTTPQALLKASRLIDDGAKQQEIVQYLFKTKPLPLLQLWGRALARLTALPEKQILTAVVTKSDMEKTKVAVEFLPAVVRDIIEMITGYSLVILLAELPAGGTQILVSGLPFEDLNKTVMQFLAADAEPLNQKPASLTGKYEYLSFHIDDSLVLAQEHLNKIIANRSSVV